MYYFVNFMKGILLGFTAVTPGISFGTMALLLHIYERGIRIFTGFFSFAFWKNRYKRREIIIFLLPILIGIGFAVYIGSYVLLLFFTSYTVFIKMFFLGIIITNSIFFYMQYIKPLFHDSLQIFSKKKLMYILCIIIGSLLVILLGSRPENREHIVSNIPNSFNEYIICFMIGILVAGVGLMPGISGSYVLLLLGYYSTFLAIVTSVALIPLIWLISGVGIGLVSTAFIIRFLFNRYLHISYCIIFGIIVASLQKIFPWQEILINDISPIRLWLGSLASFILGLILSVCNIKASTNNNV